MELCLERPAIYSWTAGAPAVCCEGHGEPESAESEQAPEQKACYSLTRP